MHRSTARGAAFVGIDIEAAIRAQRPQRGIDRVLGRVEQLRIEHGAIVLVDRNQQQQRGLVAQEPFVERLRTVHRSPCRFQRLFESTTVHAELRDAAEGLRQLCRVVAAVRAVYEFERATVAGIDSLYSEIARVPDRGGTVNYAMCGPATFWTIRVAEVDGPVSPRARKLARQVASSYRAEPK